MVDTLPLDIFDYIAMKDERLYHRLMLSFPTFARVNMKRLGWWMNLFGVTKVLSTTPTTHMTSNKIWRQEWDTLRRKPGNLVESSMDIIEYFWTKDNHSHRINGPAYICNVFVGEAIGEEYKRVKYRCVFWANEGSIVREKGFSQNMKKWGMHGNLLLHIEHGSWNDVYGIDAHLIQAKKEICGLDWKYSIHWMSENGYREFVFSDDFWCVGRYVPIWNSTSLSDVLKEIGWKAYLRNVTTTKALFKSLTKP